MSLTITEVGTSPIIQDLLIPDGPNEQESRTITQGLLQTAYGQMDWEKHFVENLTYRIREDFVIIRTGDVPEIGETFARINRAAFLGERALPLANLVIGALSNKEDDAGHKHRAKLLEFEVEFPIELDELADTDEVDINQEGEGLFWLRIANGHIDFYADNPAVQGDNYLGVFIRTEAPDAKPANPNRMRWHYADALLTPSYEDLPGALGDLSVRQALLDLRPGVSTI